MVDIGEENNADSNTDPDSIMSDPINCSLANGPRASLDEFYPEPKHVFSLWQTFLDRVNPLIKVIHVSTLQPRLVNIATHRVDSPRSEEALLFSIFTMAAISLAENECIALLGYAKSEAVHRFSSGVRIALKRVDLMKSHDIVLLQALVLYMVCSIDPCCH